MARRWMYGMSLVMWLVGGCGDGDAAAPTSGSVLGASGLPLTSYMDELSEANRRTFCRWQADNYGGAGSSVPCGDSTYTLPSLEECTASPTAFAHVQLEVTEACIEDVRAQGDVCHMPDSEACREVAKARGEKAPSNGACSSDRWATSKGCETPDYY